MGRKEIRGDSSENPEDFGRCAGEEEAPSVRACARASGGGGGGEAPGLVASGYFVFFFSFCLLFHRLIRNHIL